MTKNGIRRSCGIIVAVLLTPTQALCDGYGYYGWGRGWPSIGVPGALEDKVPAFKGLEIDLRHDHFTLGYLYDAASLPEDRCGWRLNLGLDIVVTNLVGTNVPSGIGFGLEGLSSDLYDAIGFGIETKAAYGIGVVRTDRLRLWAGPCVRLNADYVDPKRTAFEQEALSIEADPKGVILSLGGGIEGGIRYDVSTDLTLEVSTGFLYSFFGYYQRANLKINGQSLGSDDSFLTGQEPFVFVQIALGFHFTTPRQDKP